MSEVEQLAQELAELKVMHKLKYGNGKVAVQAAKEMLFVEFKLEYARRWERKQAEMALFTPQPSTPSTPPSTPFSSHEATYPVDLYRFFLDV